MVELDNWVISYVQMEHELIEVLTYYNTNNLSVSQWEALEILVLWIELAVFQELVH